MNNVEHAAERILAGDRRSLARAISEIENETERGRGVLHALYQHARHAHLIGITGSAGSGKSTLTAELARSYRLRGDTVAIIAVDPSSPFTRGAILGDRIRMQDLANDPAVFIRSLATRGALGGLSAATLDVATVLSAAGYDTILVETVGAGQDEVDVAEIADTTLVVNTPGAGDDVQTIKAGIMEVADLLVVNKADLPGAEAVMAQLLALLSLQNHEGGQVPVIRVSALRHEGISELLAAADSHRDYLRHSGEEASLRLRQARHAILAALRAGISRRLDGDEARRTLEQLTADVAAGGLDPHAASAQLMRELT